MPSRSVSVAVARRCVRATLVPWLAVAVVTASPARQSLPNATNPAKPATVLFMCPHGAAKSVLASAYFQRLAKERGLNVVVDAAGTEPDRTVAPRVADHLTKNGYAVPVAPPRRVSADDLAKADVVISLGCDLKGLPQPRGTLLKWDDVPGPSENFAGADAAIRAHVEALIDELVRAKP